MIKQPKRLALIFASLGLSTAVFAQTPPPYNAGSALKDAQPVQPQAPRKAPEPVIIQSEEKPLALPAGQTLTINAFRFEGADFIPEAELQAALASFKGQALSMIDIEAAAGRITALYRERGYLVARAYVPKQDASGGTLTIRVLVGHYGKVSIKNQSLVRDAVVEPYFAPLSGESAVARADLERAMLLVSDLPGATMPRLTISPGEAPGTSDFDVDVGAGKRVAAYLYEDNYGSRYTGRNRFNVGADFNSPTAHGDRLSLSGMASETGGLLNGRVAYSLPLASNGLKGEVAYSKTTYELGNTYKDLDATGYADTLEATFSLPLQRGREENLTAAFNLAARQMHDELRAAGTTTPKHAEVATVSLAYERYTRLFGRDAYLSASGGVSYGHLSISDRDEEDLNQAGADTVGQYGKASAVLAARLALAERLSLSTSLTLQQALFGKNLDSSEQLMISGTRGVMAFEQSASGDNGFLFNTELRYALPSVAGIEHSVAIFADSGYVRLENPAYTTVQSTYLADAGIGYSLTYKQLFARAQFASSVSKTPAAVNGGSDNRFLFQAGAFF